MTDIPLPLDGLLVISLEQAVAAPVCASRLAQAGARVIKVERPEGDFAREYDDFVKGEATYFVCANQHKESVRLDLKADGDLALMKRMLAKADVFIQNLAVGVAARLGLDADSLRAVNPKLVTCSISGYGEEGECAHMKAYDMLIQAESGLASISGGNRVGISLADIVTGINAYGAVMEALALRQKTGTGSHIELSLFGCLADLMAVPILQQMYTGRTPQNRGMHHPSIAPYGNFPTRDGTDMVISVQNNREWKRLCEDVLDLPDLVEDDRFTDNVTRTQNRHILDPIIGEASQRFTQAELIQRFEAAGIAYGRLNELPDILDHPALRLSEIRLPDGQTAKLPAGPALKSWQTDEIADIPALGQHDEAIRREFG